MMEIGFDVPVSESLSVILGKRKGGAAGSRSVAKADAITAITESFSQNP